MDEIESAAANLSSPFTPEDEEPTGFVPVVTEDDPPHQPVSDASSRMPLAAEHEPSRHPLAADPSRTPAVGEDEHAAEYADLASAPDAEQAEFASAADEAQHTGFVDEDDEPTGFVPVVDEYEPTDAPAAGAEYADFASAQQADGFAAFVDEDDEPTGFVPIVDGDEPDEIVSVAETEQGAPHEGWPHAGRPAANGRDYAADRPTAVEAAAWQDHAADERAAAESADGREYAAGEREAAGNGPDRAAGGREVGDGPPDRGAVEHAAAVVARMSIPGLGLVGADGPRIQPAPGSIEEAMRAEIERPRPRPKESDAMAALHAWCRARTAVVPSGFTIQVQVLDPSAPSYRFDLEPPDVDDPEYAADKLSGLLGDLWLTEAQTEPGGWLFARIDAAGRTLRIDRWYDQVPDWWDNPIEPRLDVNGLVRRLYGRGPEWQPSYLEQLYISAG